MGLALIAPLILAASAAPTATLTPGRGVGSTPPQRFLVSTTSDVAGGVGVPAVEDGDLVLVAEGAPARAVRTLGHWLAACGLDPLDVDALGRRPGEAPGSYRRLAFSTLSNVGGFLDGDVLGLAAGGGLEVLVSEATLAASLGLAGTSIDVDALAWDDFARLHFSLQSDLADSSIGPVRNGDVLRLEPDGTARRVLTEMDIEEKYLLATGTAALIGDVHGLELVQGEALVTIQIPGSGDGGVLDCGQSPSFLVTDAGAGLGGAELDALALVEDGDVLAGLGVSPQANLPGTRPLFTFRGEPGASLLVLWSGGSGFLPFSAPGFGGWYLDPADPWLNSIFLAPTLPLAPLDAGGVYQVNYTLPVGVAGQGLGGGWGWTFQVMDLATLGVSAPFRVSML